MTKIEAVVFDLDGTLCDTREFIFQAYEYTLAKHGHTAPDRSEIASQIGRRMQEIYAALAPGADYEVLAADHRAFMAENINLLRPIEHVVEVVVDLRKRGYKIAIWTSRGVFLDEALHVSGVSQDMFDAVVSAPDVAHGKPDPEGLFMTLDQIDVLPQHAVMVGDATVDIEAGTRGGVAATIGLSHGFGTREELEAAGADYIIDSLLALVPILDTIEQE